MTLSWCLSLLEKMILERLVRTMAKIAFVFPGQGAQVVGMGKDVYDHSAKAKEVFDRASEAVDLDLKALCFEENDNINITEYTQVCLLTTSVAIMEELLSRGIKPDVAAGLSLGEYCALVAVGSMNYVDAAKAVRKRGIYMQEEVPAGKGGMAAILGMDKEVIEENIEEFEQVQVANYNCPGQIVISGETEQVKQAADKLKEAGAEKSSSFECQRTIPFQPFDWCRREIKTGIGGIDNFRATDPICGECKRFLHNKKRRY